jgi:hypothetical protein
MYLTLSFQITVPFFIMFGIYIMTTDCSCAHVIADTFFSTPVYFEIILLQWFSEGRYNFNLVEDIYQHTF